MGEAAAPSGPLIYNRIGQNRRRTFLLMAAFFCLFSLPLLVVGIVAVSVLSGEAQLAAAAVWLAAMAALLTWLVYFALLRADRTALRLVGAAPVTRQQQPELYRQIENLCLGAGLPQPALYVIDSDAINALTTGRGPDHASLAMTRGLLHKLEPHEIEAVLAHELSHVGNRDTLLMTAIVFCVWALNWLPDQLFVYRADDYSRVNATYRGSNAMVGVVVYMTFGPLALLIGMLARLFGFAAAREREFLADATATRLAGDPAAMARALTKISRDAASRAVPAAITEPLMLVAPAGAANLFLSTHPPIEERLRRLLAM